LLLTEWEEFREVDWARVRDIVERPLVVDGRNFLSRENLASQGFRYVDVGRSLLERREASLHSNSQ
jgi:UDPglucose 6-dehydrogenase